MARLLLVFSVSDSQTLDVTLLSADSTPFEWALLKLLLRHVAIESACSGHHLGISVLLIALHDGIEAHTADAGANEECCNEDHHHCGIFHSGTTLLIIFFRGILFRDFVYLNHHLVKLLLLLLHDTLPSILLVLLTIELIILVVHLLLHGLEFTKQEVNVLLFTISFVCDVLLVLLDPLLQVNDALILLHDTIEKDVELIILVLLPLLLGLCAVVVIVGTDTFAILSILRSHIQHVLDVFEALLSFELLKELIDIANIILVEDVLQGLVVSHHDLFELVKLI